MLTTKMFCVFLLITINTINWEEDFKHAQSKANDSQKYLLVYFSGSDWCANCYRFKKAVLEDTNFNDFAMENLVLYNADFPRKKKNQLSQGKQDINNTLAARYNKENTFPRVVMIDGEGNLISDFDGLSFQKGPSEFIDHIKQKFSK